MSDEFSTLESQNIRLIEAEEKHYRDRDIAKLESLAKMYGYKLVPIKKYERYLPCVCGCNRRISWSCWNRSPDDSNGIRYKGHYVKLECRRCGQTVTGENDAEAKHNWNELIKEMSKENNNV